MFNADSVAPLKIESTLSLCVCVCADFLRDEETRLWKASHQNMKSKLDKTRQMLA